MKTLNLCVASVTGPIFTAGTFSADYVVQTPNGVIYVFFRDQSNDFVYIKSTDGGYGWDTPVVVRTGTIVNFAIWYDRWSNISAGLIHCVCTDSGTDDTYYRTIDTENSDSLSTETTIFAGATTATTGHLSVARAVGGNVYCKTIIDAGAEGGFYRLPNANVPNGAWDAARTIDETLVANDAILLAPDFDAADNQDIIAIYWDSSAQEISRKLYDDSANSWSETSIIASVDPLVSGILYRSFNIGIDIANTQLIVVAWSPPNVLGGDLKCWTVDSGSITACTDVVSLGAGEASKVVCAVSVDETTGDWHVFYSGSASESWNVNTRIYKKISTDGGSTWGAETVVCDIPGPYRYLVSTPVHKSDFGEVPVLNSNTLYMGMHRQFPSRRASHQLLGG